MPEQGPARTPIVEGEGFPRSARLRRQSEIRRVLQVGWRRRTEHLVVLLLARDEEPSRLGLAVSRRVGGAVERNRVKRRLREGFRRRLRALLSAPADLLIQALPGAAAAPQMLLEAEVAEAIAAWSSKGRPGGRPRGR
jgi:ribonuclease P protein component